MQQLGVDQETDIPGVFVVPLEILPPLLQHYCPLTYRPRRPFHATGSLLDDLLLVYCQETQGQTVGVPARRVL